MWRKAQPLVLLVDVRGIGFKLLRLFKQICVFPHQETRENGSEKGIEMY